MGEDGARVKDWLRARGHHLCPTDTVFWLLFILCLLSIYISYLKGNRPIKSIIEFLLKLHTVVECYMVSEKNEVK